jgi:hypothetical protein
MTTVSPDDRVVILSSLVQFEQELRDAETLRDVGYIAVNDARRVVDFRQAFLWHEDDFHRITIEAASNVSEVDANTPHIRRLGALAGWITTNLAKDKVLAFSVAGQPDKDVSDAVGALARYLIFVPLTSRAKAFSGGLVLASDKPWREADVAVLTVMGRAVSHAWNSLAEGRTVSAIKLHFQHYWRRYLAALVVLFLLPVRQYVLAPAEVVPQRPLIVAAPLVGVIERVYVEPNDAVEQGALLFRMEDIDLANKHILAQRSVEVAEAEYLKNAQSAFSCDECRGRLPELQALLERERATLAWTAQQLAMAEVRAPVSGVATFSDVNELIGRPVSTGQRVMTVSDPSLTRLRVSLAVDDVIHFNEQADVIFYPSTNPLDSYRATLYSISYEPRLLPEQTLAFTLLADFSADAPPRLGLRGTAKVYGKRAPLIYLALRRPLSWLRRSLGW